MKIVSLIDEDAVNYKDMSMFIAFPYCTFKCEIDNGCACCQNSDLAKAPVIDVDVDTVIQRYITNEITTAIVCGGLEPLDSFDDLCSFIRSLRNDYLCDDTVVIYTGYNKEEVLDKIAILSQFKNIIVKFGRFILGQNKHRDEILGVDLASDNQYAEVIGGTCNMKVTVNKNADLVKEIRNKLKENGGYCPCSVVKNEDTKCMCKAFREMIANGESGECHCGLYVAEGKV